MTSLVADYGTSSGSESDSFVNSDDTDNILKEEEENGQMSDHADDGEGEEDEENDDDHDDGQTREKHEKNKSYSKKIKQNLMASKDKLPLPTPDFNRTPTLKTSVFSNPFVEAEKAKSAILEKHVKMTPTLDDTKMINGKKICWNYRKGRCRFGHNCTFAHDSDLHRTAAEMEAINVPHETLICQTPYNGQLVTIENDDEIDQENDRTAKRKKRPGLSHTLIPSKKVLKMYKAQQTKGVSS